MADASSILDYARYAYPVVISDAGSAFGDWTLSQAQLSDEVLLISTNELSSLHSAQRAIHYLETNGIDPWKIKLVLNRYDEHYGVSSELIQNSLGIDVFHVLPTDEASVQKSLMEGKPLAPGSKLGEASGVAGRAPGRPGTSASQAFLPGRFAVAVYAAFCVIFRAA